MEEKSCRKNETYLRLNRFKLPDVIYVKDTQGRKIVTNKADWTSASGGKTMEDVLGKSDFDTYPAEMAASDFGLMIRTSWTQRRRFINREEPGRDTQRQSELAV